MSGQTRVLVCCDDPERQALYRQVLAAAGHAVEMAPSPARAAALIPGGDWTALVVDIAGFPTQGFFLITHVREQLDDSRLPILLVTDEMRPTDTIRGLQSGATDCVTRSAPLGEVTLAIERYGRPATAPEPADPVFPPSFQPVRMRPTSPSGRSGHPRLGGSSLRSSAPEPPGEPAPAGLPGGSGTFTRPPAAQPVAPVASTPPVTPVAPVVPAAPAAPVATGAPDQPPVSAVSPLEWPANLELPEAPPAASLPADTVGLLQGPLRERVYHEILGRIDTGIIVLSSSYQIDYMNTAARQLLEIWEPGRPILPARLGGLDRADFLSQLSWGALQGSTARPIALYFDRGVSKSVIGSITSLLDDVGQPIGQLIFVRDHKAQLEIPRSPEDLRLSREVMDTVSRAEQSLNVLARSVQVLAREKIMANPAALRSFELMRNDFERLFALVRVLKDVRERR